MNKKKQKEIDIEIKKQKVEAAKEWLTQEALKALIPEKKTGVKNGIRIQTPKL